MIMIMIIIMICHPASECIKWQHQLVEAQLDEWLQMKKVYWVDAIVKQERWVVFRLELIIKLDITYHPPIINKLSLKRSKR